MNLYKKNFKIIRLQKKFNNKWINIKNSLFAVLRIINFYHHYNQA